LNNVIDGFDRVTGLGHFALNWLKERLEMAFLPGGSQDIISRSFWQ
jgi:hypothetical protein